MNRPLQEYHRPTDAKRASSLLERISTETFPLYIAPCPTAVHERSFEAVVDLSALNLEYIRVNDDDADGYIRIGALTTLSQLTGSSLLISYACGLLPQAARLAGHHGLRNIANVGGVLTSSQGPPEVLLALMVLDATIVFNDNSFVSAQLLETSDHRGKFITEIRLPHKRAHTALQRVARTPMDEAIVAVAAAVYREDNLVKGVRLALSGVTSTPRRFPSVEELLTKPVYDDAVHKALMTVISPVPDYRGSIDYRREMAAVLTRRALAIATQDYELSTN